MISTTDIFPPSPHEEQPPLRSAPGLLQGHTGMAIVHYLIGRHIDNHRFSESGLALLNEVSDVISSVEDLSYAHGLAGIGWGIEWLVQQGLLADTDTDEVLSDVDDLLYKSTLFGKRSSISLHHGTTGLLAYFHKRYTSRNPGSSHIKNLYHHECISLLIDDIATQQTGQRYPFSEGLFLAELGGMMAHLSAVSKINIVTTENILYDAVAATDHFLQQLCDARELPAVPGDGDYYLRALFLAACYEIAGRNTGHATWQLHASVYMETLLQRLETQPAMHSSTDPFRQLAVYSLVSLVLPSCANLAVRQQDICLQTQPPHCLAGGSGLIAISRLAAAAPELTGNWADIFIACV
ncbi:hypothetical protein SAMN04488128_103403 [Chitinophaga eiseniae]|uniref:Lanthionine synthetase C-like protein n=1 Tax=Chitinophaga eiseniae TaxID=634771 RepID=A0A1T4SS51_9BACT|nr:hypothetical protein [Chitinophaga eiseniae]SKA31065.1 hypothetical protein SAMN04488128_103403 [Chitinophaga eiseniae]